MPYWTSFSFQTRMAASFVADRTVRRRGVEELMESVHRPIGNGAEK
jgi:hypothetical protein